MTTRAWASPAHPRAHIRARSHRPSTARAPARSRRRAMTTAAAVPDSAVAASFAQSWPAIADLAVTKEELLAVPVPVILGVALVVGVGVNAAIVVGAGAFAASKDDDAERATLTSPATSDRETNNRPASASASASASDDEPDGSDGFDLESILSLVEDAEAAEIERKVSESPGRDVYEPASFAQMVADAADAVRAAVADGQNLLEVQLPSTAATVDSDASQAVNLRLAAAFGDDFVRRGNPRTGLPWRTHVLVPDRTEYERARAMFEAEAFTKEDSGTAASSVRGGVRGRVTIGTLAEVDTSLAGRLEQTLAGTLGAEEESLQNAMQADLLVAVNCSSVELLQIEAYKAALLEGDGGMNEGPRDAYFSEEDAVARTSARCRPLVVFNCDLDDLRGDLGLVGFPPKELHARFLSRIMPAFYVRRREYNKTFLGGKDGAGVRQVYYGGALFREYPGPWQVMYREEKGGTDDGVADGEVGRGGRGGARLVSVRSSRERFRLREVKQALKEAAGVDEEKGSVDEFLRGEAGVWEKLKPGTWWEQDDAIASAASQNWRT